MPGTTKEAPKKSADHSLGGCRGQFLCQPGIAFRQLPDGRVAAGRGQFGNRGFLQGLHSGLLAALVGDHLEYIGFLAQAIQVACREIPLRAQKLETDRVACQFLL